MSTAARTPADTDRVDFISLFICEVLRSSFGILGYSHKLVCLHCSINWSTSTYLVQICCRSDFIFRLVNLQYTGVSQILEPPCSVF